MALEDAGQWDFTEDVQALSDMDAGKDDNSGPDAGEIGELAVAEIGAAAVGAASSYFRLALGGVPDDQLQTGAARVTMDLQDGADADADDNTQIRLRLTDKNRSKTIDKSRWLSKTGLESGTVSEQPVLEFPGVDEATFAREGRVLVVEWRNPSVSQTLELTNCTGTFPIVGAQ